MWTNRGVAGNVFCGRLPGRVFPNEPLQPDLGLLRQVEEEEEEEEEVLRIWGEEAYLFLRWYAI